MSRNRFKDKQQGIVLLGMMAVILIIIATMSLQYLNQSDLNLLKEQKNQQVLAEAKISLLAFSTKQITKTPTQVALTCGFNCERPGELPCPDLDDDGISDGPCDIQTKRLGRLPWKTLGLNDLRDGSGEHLWYALSNNYKSSPRDIPINSDNFGSISLRNTQGNLINDATNQSGLVAVLIAPNSPLLRADKVQQNRNNNNRNNPTHYLDIALNEDNANFTENSTNGFISGPIKIDNDTILNDVILPITRKQMNRVMESRVLAEVMEAMLYRYCSINNVNVRKHTCNNPLLADFYPDPAAIHDPTCLTSSSNATVTECSSDANVILGRIPVSGHSEWSANGQNSNSILDGDPSNNWFQQNGWRELILYARAPACVESTPQCSGTGFLSLENAAIPMHTSLITSKQVILISSGSTLTGQTRETSLSKLVLSNYLEDENLLIPNNTFSRFKMDNTRNDKLISIP